MATAATTPLLCAALATLQEIWAVVSLCRSTAAARCWYGG
jgi:hypothetical protein